MEEFIIDRSEPPQEIETQIGRLAEKFQELEQDQDTLSGGNEFQEIEDLEIPPQESDDSAPVGIPPIVNLLRRKEERKRSLSKRKLIWVVNIPLRIC